MVELTINEWLENGEVTLETKYADASKYDTEVRCSFDSGNKYYMEIDINNKTLIGNIFLGSEEIPQIVYDLVDELDDMKSTATVAACEEVLSYSLAVEAWRRLAFGTDDAGGGYAYANAIISLIGDLWGFGVTSLAIGILCAFILSQIP